MISDADIDIWKPSIRRCVQLFTQRPHHSVSSWLSTFKYQTYWLSGYGQFTTSYACRPRGLMRGLASSIITCWTPTIPSSERSSELWGTGFPPGHHMIWLAKLTSIYVIQIQDHFQGPMRHQEKDFGAPLPLSFRGWMPPRQGQQTLSPCMQMYGLKSSNKTTAWHDGTCMFVPSQCKS